MNFCIFLLRHIYQYISYLTCILECIYIPFMGFTHSSVGKESACNAGDPSWIPGLGKSPGEGIGYPLQYSWAFLVAQLVKNPPAMWGIWVRSLGWEDPWRRDRLPTPVLWSEEFHRLCSPWGPKELDMTERLSLSHPTSYSFLTMWLSLFWVRLGRSWLHQPTEEIMLCAKSCPALCEPMDCSPPGALFMEFSRQEYLSGLPFPPPGTLPSPGIKPASFESPSLTNVEEILCKFQIDHKSFSLILILPPSPFSICFSLSLKVLTLDDANPGLWGSSI